MHSKIARRILIGLLVLSAIAGAYLKGRNDVWEMEFKECQGNMMLLTYWETNQPPELKEFVKARYYYLANEVSKDFVGEPKNYGPISTNVEKLAQFKGPSSGNAEYASFLQRFNL